MKRQIKLFLMRDGVQAVLAWLVAGYLKLVYRTTRWQVIGAVERDQALAAGTPFIACFWHNRMMLVPPSFPDPGRLDILISAHRDGKIISAITGRLGYGTIQGSSTRGGAKGLKEMLGALKSGRFIAITPDGPRGPRMRLGKGALVAAKLSGAPLIPLATGFSSVIEIGSWDRLLIPLPFGRGRFVFGEPIAVERSADDAELERQRATLEGRLIEMSITVDQAVGRQPIRPLAEAEGA